MRGIRTGGAGPIKLLQTEVKDERYKFASAIHLLRFDAKCVETACMLPTIPLK
jgi:hypothetical protein